MEPNHARTAVRLLRKIYIRVVYNMHSKSYELENRIIHVPVEVCIQYYVYNSTAGLSVRVITGIQSLPPAVG